MEKKYLLIVVLMVLMVPFSVNAQTLYFSEDFESGSMPNGWTQDQLSGETSWTVGIGDFQPAVGAGHATYNVKINVMDKTSKTRLITPVIDLSNVPQALLSFMHIQRKWADDVDELRVYYRNQSSASWTLLNGQEYTEEVSSWTTEEGIVLPNLTATYQIAFEFKSNYGFGVGIDYIHISDSTGVVSNCPDTFEVPYAYGFENVADIDCWTIISNDSRTTIQSNAWALSNQDIGVEPARTGDRFFLFNYSSFPPQYLISPELSGITSGLHVVFWYRQYTFGVETFHVGYSTTDNNPEHFTWGDAITASTTYRRFSADYPADTKYVAIKLTSDDQWYLFIDDFLFEESASCPEPTAVTAIDETTTSAKLNWTAGSTETAWDIFVTSNATLVPDANTTPTYSSISTRPYLLANLTQGTTYYAYVRGRCSETDLSAWSSPAVFNTECDVMSLPYGPCTFEYGSNVCWNTLVGDPSNNGIYAHEITAGQHALVFFKGSADQALIAVLPEVDPAYQLKYFQISFSAAFASNATTSADPIKVGIMTDPEDASTFVQLGDDITPTTDFEPYLVLLNLYKGNGHYIAIQTIGNSGLFVETYVTDVVVDSIPCMPVEALGAIPSTNSAELSWTAYDDATSWSIYYKKTSETAYTLVDHVTSNPYILSPLDQGISYDYYVVSNCSETESSPPSEVYTFQTECGILTLTDTESFTEDFEDPVVTAVYNTSDVDLLKVPGCWDNYTDNTDVACAVPHLLKSDAGIDGHNYSSPASQVLSFYGQGNGYAALPEFTNPVKKMQIDFKWAVESTSKGTLALGYITAEDDGTFNTFQEIKAFTATSDKTMLESGTLYLNQVPTTATRLVFRWLYDQEGSCNVDDVEVALIPKNLPPTELTCTTFRARTATFTWVVPISEDVTGYEYQYKLAGGENWSDVETTTELTATITGLDPETTYDFRVRATYSEMVISDYVTTQFTTNVACPVPTELSASNLTTNTAELSWNTSPDVDFYAVEYRTSQYEDAWFKEDFEDAAAFANWTFTSMNAANALGTIFGAGRLADAKHKGDYGFRFSSFTPKTSDEESYDQYLVSPELTTAGELKFWAKKYANQEEFLYVGYSTSTNDVSAFTWSDALNLTRNWQEFSQELPDDVKYFAFHYFGNERYYVYVDDITIGAYVIPASAWITATDAAVNTGHCQITGLTAYTDYDARVYSNCSSNPENENSMVTFTTFADGKTVFTNATGDGLWSNAANWIPSTPSLTDHAIIRADVTITGDAAADKITLEGSPTANITINDGGTLQTNNISYATVKKNITGYGAGYETNRANYYLIADPTETPVYTIIIGPTGLLTGNYDLYSWDYSYNQQQWRNYKTATFVLYPKLGYLYANESDVELNFMGTVIPNNTDVPMILSFHTENNGYDFNGWNLIGNPFTCDAVVNLSETEGEYAMSYYRMNATGTKLEASTAPIKPMEGIFVKATRSGQYVIFRRPSANTSVGNSQLNINVAQVVNSRDAIAETDNAIIRFDGGNSLEKFVLCEGGSKLTIPQDGKDYAVVASEGQGVIPLDFKVAENGTYTLTVSAPLNSQLTTLILIDNLTGNHVNLLQTPSYTFESRRTDYASRFKLVFSENENDNENENFAFINNGEIIVETPWYDVETPWYDVETPWYDVETPWYDVETPWYDVSTIQVIDMLGRVILTRTVTPHSSLPTPNSPGVYVLRLINGDRVRTQKIVVE